MANSLSIGKLAEAADVGVETIRFYEREGLIAEPPRSRAGYRRFPPDSVDRILFICRAKALGFTLKEIKELLSLRVNADKTCRDVRKMARTKITDVEGKIADLESIKAALEHLARRCRGDGPTEECPILGALAKEERT